MGCTLKGEIACIDPTGQMWRLKDKVIYDSLQRGKCNMR